MSSLLKLGLFGAGSAQLWFVIVLAYVQFLLVIIFFMVRSHRYMVVATSIIGILSLNLYSQFDCSVLRKVFYMLGYVSVGIAIPYLLRCNKKILTVMSAIAICLSFYGITPYFVRALSWVVFFHNMNFDFLSERMRRLLLRLGSYTMGVYLVHTVTFRLNVRFYHDVIEKFIPNDYVALLPAVSMIYVGSVMFVHGFRRCKFLFGM